MLFSSEIFGPVHHNQLKNNVNGIGGGGGAILYISILYNVAHMGPDDIHFL